MSPSTTFRCSPSVAATQVDDTSTVLLQLSEQTYFELNRTGTRLWHHLDEHGEVPLSALVDLLDDDQKNVSRADVRADVESFLQALIQKNLLEKS